MFSHAAESGIRWPKLRFHSQRLGRLTLSVAGRKAQKPGSVNVVISDASGEGEASWHGRIVENDLFERGKSCTATTEEFLLHLAQDPIGAAQAYGKATGRCCFCARELTDERSVLMGYGPVCAEKWSLPWGDRPDEPIVQTFDFGGRHEA
jgi:hypothetical protein